MWIVLKVIIHCGHCLFLVWWGFNFDLNEILRFIVLCFRHNLLLDLCLQILLILGIIDLDQVLRARNINHLF